MARLSCFVLVLMLECNSFLGVLSEYEDDDTGYGPGIWQANNTCWDGIQKYQCLFPVYQLMGISQNYSCPIYRDGMVLAAVCTEIHVNATKDLYLPYDLTVLCITNSTIGFLEPSSFINYTQLRHLNLSTSIGTIHPDAFQGIPKLTSLILGNGADSNATNLDLFKPLQELKVLGLYKWKPEKVDSEHYLKFECLNNVSRKLKILDMSYVNEENSAGIFWELKEPLFSSFSKIKLRCLSLEHNQIITIRANILNKFKHLEQFFFASNYLLGGDYQTVEDLANMTELRFIDMRYQSYLRFPYKQQKKKHHKKYIGFGENHKNCLHLPPNLVKLNIGYFRLPTLFKMPSVCKKPLKITVINAPRFFLSLKKRFSKPLKNLPKLRRLDLSDSRLVVDSLRILFPLKNLEYLNLNSFNLYRYLPETNNRSEWEPLMSEIHFPKLENLSLASNHLRFLPYRFFQNLTSLKWLDLSNNLLTEIPYIQTLNGLFHLNFAHNKMLSMTPKIMTRLEYHACRLNETHNMNFTLNLTDNRFICACSDLEAIERGQKSKIHYINYTCSFASKQVVELHHININNMKSKYCGQWDKAMICFVYTTYFLLLIFSFLSNLTYRQRHKMKYWILRVFKINLTRTVNMTYDCDAFLVCHSDEVGKIEPLYKTLEDLYGYRLFIIERDGLGARLRTDGIKEGFLRSHHMIIVLSRKLLADTLFKYTLHLALERHDQREGKVIFVLLNFKENYFWNPGELPAVLEYLMRTSVCLPWKKKYMEGIFDGVTNALGRPHAQVVEEFRLSQSYVLCEN